MLRNEGDRLTRVVVCSPDTEYFDVDNLEAHNIKEVADRDLTIEQHAMLRETLRQFGSEVIDMGELEGHPNSVFTRDMAVVTPKGYIKMSMGIETRKGEENKMAATLDFYGEPCIGAITKPGTVEGGDVILCGSVAFVGLTQRTNKEGIRQLTELLERMNTEVRIADIPDSYLHLDQTIGVLGPDRLIYCGGIFPEDLFRGFEAIPSSCREFNVNFISLGDNEILAPASNRSVIEKAEKAGVIIHALDLSEFWKGTGGPNCLIMPLERR
ncbi:MAG: amidinotransferase [Candidatus Aminicenantes bacterium]|nr:amidinotransferase [Candidatus Aminicenantes bacterium]